jgi:hypothetical protein
MQEGEVPQEGMPPQEGEEQQAPPQEEQQQEGQEGSVPKGEPELLGIAQKLVNMSDQERASVISQLDKQEATKVMQYVQYIAEQDKAIDGDGVNMAPYPEKLPPRRDGGV